jgi:hypothetical protein
LDNQLHVLPENDQWIIRRSGQPTILDRCNEKADALKIARNVLKSTGGRIVVHDGTGGRTDESIAPPRRRPRTSGANAPFMFG